MYAPMSGVGLKTRLSIVMVKTVLSPYIKHATALLQYQRVLGTVENVNRKSDQLEFDVNCVRRVMEL